MSSGFVPIQNLRSDEEIAADPFFSEVVKRESGLQKHPGIFRRLQNPECLKCQATFKQKYPDIPFAPVCQGIYGEEDVEEMCKTTGSSPDEAREFLDPVFWAEQYIVVKNKDNEYVPFSTKDREYQEAVLRCTAQYQVDRMGRGMGKTTCAYIKDLQKSYMNENYEICVVCPAKAQAQMWFEEINTQLDNSPLLRGAVKRKVQAPYYIFEFYNGSKIKIFTAGSKAGRGAQALRGQSPKRVRLDEQDFLNEQDYDAITALLKRFPESEFHGSSTPTGQRQMYWAMCTQFPNYREHYVPITMKKGWNKQMELEYRKEAKTADRYNHEYLALFGELEAGVFKAVTIDAAKKQYKYVEIDYSVNLNEVVEVHWNGCSRDTSRKYVLGIDWNGNGTGTRYRVIEFNPLTNVRRCVYTETVDVDGATTQTSLRHIQLLNRVFHLDHIYCDKGWGFAQDELLRAMGKAAMDPGYKEPEFKTDDIKLLRVNFIGSKETLKTNRLVPKRDPNSPYIEDKELERATKPFMVEGAQMTMEQLKVEFSADDERLELQMRDYRVKTWSANGQAASYEAKNEGDHDLDAWMLAMLGVELNYGLFFDPNAHDRLAAMIHVSGFGSGVQAKVSAARQRMLQQGVPSRSQPKTATTEDHWTTVYQMRNGAYVAPTPGGGTRGFVPGGRTQIFRNQSNRTSFPGALRTKRY